MKNEAHTLHQSVKLSLLLRSTALSTAENPMSHHH